MFIFSQKVLKLLAVALCLPALALAQSAPAPIKMALIEGLSGPFANTGEALAIISASANCSSARQGQFQRLTQVHQSQEKNDRIQYQSRCRQRQCTPSR
jgi:hypothetical protein